MKLRVPQFLRPPTFRDPEKTRRAELLNGTLVLTATGASLYLLFIALSRAPASRDLVGVLAGVMMVSVGLLKALLHRGYVRTSAILLAVAVWAIFTVPIVVYDGIRDTGVMGYYVVVLITSLTLGRRSLVFVDLLASASLIFVYAAEMQGILVTSLGDVPSPVDLVSSLVTLNGTAVLASFSVGRLAEGESRVRRERDKAQRYLDIAGAIIVALDAEGCVVLVNRKGCEVLRRAEPDVMGRDWVRTFVPESARQRAEGAFRSLMSCGEEGAIYMESPVVTSDGGERIIAWHHTALMDDAGGCIGTLSSGEDITERRGAEDALAASQERLLTILNSIEADVYVADMASYEIIFLNQHMQASFGGDLAGRICYDVFRNAPAPCPHCTNRDLLDADGNPSGVVTWESHNPVTGRWYVNHDRAIRWVDGRLARVQVAMDITDHRKAEEARAHSQGLLLALSQAAQAVQRARSPEAVYQAIGDQVAQLGLDAYVLAVGDDGRTVDLVYFKTEPALMEAAVELLGHPIDASPLRIEPSPLVLRVAETGEAEVSAVDAGVIAAALPREVADRLRPLLDLMGEQQRIVAPLISAGRVRALLAMMGSGLSASDLPAVTAFANQAAIAIENARLYRETEQLVAFNERVINSMVEGLVVQDGEGVVTFVNPAAATMLGYAREELVGRHWTVYVPADQRAIVAAADARRRLGASDRYQVEMMHTDGRRLTAAVSGSPLFDGDTFVGTTGVFVDITEQVRAENALRRSEQFLADVFDAIQDGISVLDPDLNVVRTNAWIERMYAVQMPIVEKKCFQAYHQREDRCPWCPSLRTLTTGETHREIVPYRPEGEAVGWLELTTFPIKDETGRVVNIIEYVKDITDRKRAEQERGRLAAQIQAQANQMAQILATVPAGVLLLGADGSVIEANPTAMAALRDLIGAEVGDRLTHLGDRRLTELLTTPPSGGLWHEISLGGRVFEGVVRPVERGAEPEYWVLVLNDVTRERQIQDELNQQERLAAVGQLAAGIAHDFNNILATVVLYAQMASAAPDLPESSRERLDVINEQAWHATRLIGQILDFSRRSVLDRQPLDLGPLVKEQVKLLERTLPESISVELICDEDTYTVHADPTRMRQMLTNLALNARDAMPEGGLLNITLGRFSDPAPRHAAAGTAPSGKWVRLTVTDNGEGIAYDVLPHIFEPFFTTKGPGEGSGLGLAQVHGIVGQHGGRIDVTSTLGEGTTFTVDLPALPIAPVEPPARDPEALATGHGETVLVVEDNAVLREALLDVLAQLGYRGLEARNGKEALVVLAEHNDVDLVLSDLVMPEMGGQALLGAMREQGLDVPFVMVSGHPPEEVLESLKTQGLVGWLQKPPDVVHLARILAEALIARAPTLQ